MSIAIVAAVFILIACGLALWANHRFRDNERLPMQWWLNGAATWSAPRPVAVAFMPVLTTFTLASFAFGATRVAPRPGQEHLIFPALIGLGVLFVAVQALHLWLVENTVRRNDT